MFLSIFEITSRRKLSPKRVAILQCNTCDEKFERSFSQNVVKCEIHFCSKKCQGLSQQKGKILDDMKRQTWIKKYGVDHPHKLPETLEKINETCMKRFGVKWSSQASEVQEKAQQTNLERYGTKWHTQSQNFAQKATQTWMINLGVDHPMKSEKVKAKYDFVSIWKKAHETKKLNGTYAQSKSENAFFSRLNEISENVERSVCVSHDSGCWFIDFKINDVFVQFDGEYWHGLDRPFAEIQNSSSVRDKTILSSFDRDRYQDFWFQNQNLRLVRITDKESELLTQDQLREMVCG